MSVHERFAVLRFLQALIKHPSPRHRMITGHFVMVAIIYHCCSMDNGRVWSWERRDSGAVIDGPSLLGAIRYVQSGPASI